MTALDGRRWTIGGAPLGETLIPQHLLDQQVNFVRQRAPGAVFSGVVAATVSFDLSQYATL
jgi:hypothetical protein